MKQDDTTARFDEKQLVAYFSGTATPEEEQALLAWIRSSDDNRRTFAELRAVWQRGRMQRPDTQLQARFVRSLNSLNRRIDALGADAPLRRSRRIPLRRFAAAAIVAVALAAAFMTYRVATAPFVHRFHNADTVAMHVAMPDGTDVWLSPGTTLSYDDTFRIDGRNVELDGEARKNPVAILKIVKVMQDEGIGYGSINHPIDTCRKCGHRGVIYSKCPVCGSDDILRMRRITGYLVGTMDKWNDAKKAEERDRVKHL